MLDAIKIVGINKYKLSQELGINLVRIKEENEYMETRFIDNTIYYTPENRSGYTNINEVTELFSEYMKTNYGEDINADIPLKIKTRAREKTLYSMEGRSLQELYPEMAKELHPTKNGNISPENIASMSNLKLWWQCSKCSYEWREVVSTKVSHGTRCQSCGYQPIDFDTSIEYVIGEITGSYEIEYIKLFNIKEYVSGYSRVLIRLINEIANREDCKGKIDLIVDNPIFDGYKRNSGGIRSSKITRDINRCRQPYAVYVGNNDVIYIENSLGSRKVASIVGRILDLCSLPRDTVKIKYIDKQEEGSWDVLADIL